MALILPAVARRGVDVINAAFAAFNEGDHEATEALFADRVEIHSAIARTLHGDDVFHGRDGTRKWLASISDNLNFRVDVSESLEHRGFVLALATARVASLSGGPEFDQDYGIVARVEEGLIVYFESHLDAAAACASMAEHLRKGR